MGAKVDTAEADPTTFGSRWLASAYVRRWSPERSLISRCVISVEKMIDRSGLYPYEILRCERYETRSGCGDQLSDNVGEKDHNTTVCALLPK